jgi:hypothetical protein
VFCAQHENYGYRGYFLRHLTFVEYVALVQEPVRVTAASSQATASEDPLSAPRKQAWRPGRQSMREFEYANEHPLRDGAGVKVYTQKLHALQKTVIISGRPPPALPSASDPNLNSKLDDFAEYYLLLFKPWTDPRTGPEGELNWDSFADYVEHLAASKCCWDQGRLGMIQAMAHAGKLPAATMQLLTAYRFRAADRWDDSETGRLAPRASQYGQGNKGADDARNGDYSDNEDVMGGIEDAAHEFTDFGQAYATYHKEQSVIHHQLQHLRMIEKSIPYHTDESGGLFLRSAPVTYNSHRITKREQIKEIIESLKSPDLGELVPASATEPGHRPSSPTADIESVRQERGSEFASIIGNILEKIEERRKIQESLANDGAVPEAMEPYNIFLTGGPGTGKTTLINELRQLCRLVATAPTGIAASHIAGGSTHYSFFGVGCHVDASPTGHLPKKHPQISAIQRVKEADVFLLDEVSMAKDQTLGMIDFYLRTIRKEIHPFYADQAFGGMIVIVTGDFFQLPPVQYAPLYKTVLKYSCAMPNVTSESDNLITRGNHLFARFRKVELTRQQRLQDDPNASLEQQEREGMHRRLISRFRSQHKPLDDDEAITYLQSRVISTSVASESNRIDDVAWQDATYIVSNNAQRAAINLARAKVFAKDHQTGLFWWPTNVQDSAIEEMDEDLMTTYYEHQTALWEYFVAGAPCYLTDNLNPTKVCNLL